MEKTKSTYQSICYIIFACMYRYTSGNDYIQFFKIQNSGVMYVHSTASMCCGYLRYDTINMRLPVIVGMARGFPSIAGTITSKGDPAQYPL